MSVVVIGSINVDIVTYSARMPAPGESMKGETYAMVLGGKGCNQATAAARLGAPTRLIGRIGADAFGDFVRERLASRGIDARSVTTDPVAATGIAVIPIVASGQNSIIVIPGANDTLTEDVLDESALLGARVLLSQIETPLETSLKAAARVRAGGGLYVLDPAPVPDAPIDSNAWKLADITTPNEVETLKITGIDPVDLPSARAAAERLRAFGVGTAVVKLGARGVYALGDGIDLHLPPFPVTVVDTVAAGDSFNGGLAVALAEGVGLQRAIHFASACGALACTRKGSSDSVPTRAEAEAMFGTL